MSPGERGLLQIVPGERQPLPGEASLCPTAVSRIVIPMEKTSLLSEKHSSSWVVVKKMSSKQSSRSNASVRCSSRDEELGGRLQLSPWSAAVEVPGRSCH
uniref:Uncharacterized protein n=1 Tax=Knipowitschia caucasica TaxID=637954 RepID=A0AAV2L7U5_KNICA